MRTHRIALALAALAALAIVGCHGHDHPHEESAGRDDHGHAHGEQGGHDDHDDHSDHDDHDDHDDHGGHDDHDDHGHGGHDGASEVVTLWGESTQLFVEFPALVVGEPSPFAAHLTRLSDHFAIDAGTVEVVLDGGGPPPERFSVDGPSVAGIFRPIVEPAHTARRRVTLRLTGPAASEEHAMGEFRVFATRAEADAAAPEGEDESDEISYLLEQQWKVPFLVERADARPMRPSVSAFARLTLPPNANATIVAPRSGRVVSVGARFPTVGEEVAAGAPLFAISAAPEASSDPATLDLAVDQAQIAVQAAQREVDRLAPLVAEGVVAQRRLDEARSALSSADAELRSARRRRAGMADSQRVGRAGDQLGVPAPLDGEIAELLVVPGAWVEQGQALARIVDRDRLWLDVGVPEAYLGALGTVSGAWFELHGVRSAFEVDRSALVSVGTEVDAESRTLPVRFAIDNVRQELFAGQTTQANLITDSPRVAVAVPMDAVVDDGGTDVVYVQTGGESFVRRPVRLGIRDQRYVEVVDGVSPGEWVVTRGAYTVRLASTSTESVGHGHAH